MVNVCSFHMRDIEDNSERRPTRERCESALTPYRAPSICSSQCIFDFSDGRGFELTGRGVNFTRSPELLSLERGNNVRQLLRTEQVVFLGISGRCAIRFL